MDGEYVVELAEMIAELRDELGRAVAAADEQGLQFELGPVGLEATVAVSKEAKPGAKVKFWVIEVGADSSIGRTATQKVTLTLHPKMPGGRSAYVSGDAEPDED